MVQLPTPEGLELSYQAGGVPRRFFALLFDNVVSTLMLIGLFFAVSWLPDPVRDFAIGLVFLATFGVTFFYHVFFEVKLRGQTPGKALFGLRVVRTDGSPVGFVASLTRNTIRLAEVGVAMSLGAFFLLLGITAPLSIVFFLGPALFMMRTPTRQRLGDVAADTQVIRTRGTLLTSSEVTSDYGMNQTAYNFEDHGRSTRRRRRASNSTSAHPYPAQPYPAQPYSTKPNPIRPGYRAEQGSPQQQPDPVTPSWRTPRRGGER